MKSIASFVFVGLLVSSAVPVHALTLEWIRQSGTHRNDYVTGLADDNLGSLYVSSWTDAIPGQDAFGDYKLTVSKYSQGGDLLWAREMESAVPNEFQGKCIAADRFGNVVVAAATKARIPEPLLIAYDADGDLQWTRSFGTSATDVIKAISSDGLGGFYVSGITEGSLGGQHQGAPDAFVGKYDGAGNQIWIRQIGTSKWDEAQAVSADGLGNVYVTGSTYGDLGGPNAGGPDAPNRDVFVAKYDADGNFVWSRQRGTLENEIGLNISADKLGNVFVSGESIGSTIHAFLNKYDAFGNLHWTRRLGNEYTDFSRALAADGLGNAYASGETIGIAGLPNAPYYHALVSKYNAAGDLVWTNVLGTRGDNFFGLTADGRGNLFATGYTFNNLGGPNAGQGDLFLAKYLDSPVPESSTFVLIAIAIPSFAMFHQRRMFTWPS